VSVPDNVVFSASQPLFDIGGECLGCSGRSTLKLSTFPSYSPLSLCIYIKDERLSLGLLPCATVALVEA